MCRKLLVLIDLSGTLHVGDTPTPGAVDALRLLRAHSARFSLKFVTNTTKESSANLHSRLRRCGFGCVRRSEIFSSLSAARRLVLRRKLRPFLFLEPEALEDFQDIAAEGEEPHNAVVVGLAPSKFDFPTLNRAFRILLADPTAPLIAIHKGRYYRTDDGLCLGPGPFVECLEFATGRKVCFNLHMYVVKDKKFYFWAEIVGKPEAEFFRQAVSSCSSGCDGGDGEAAAEFALDDAFMIGDDVRDDCMGAIRAGMQAILVRTGKFRSGDENEIPPESRICVENFYEAVQFLLAKFA